MKFNTLLKKMFIGGEWYIAYRKLKNQDTSLDNYDEKPKYIVLPNTKKYWFADPFLYSDGLNDYIFCEAFDRAKEKGCIGVASFSSGKMQNFKLIIEQKYHMSYPCVFNYNGTHYMIPETGENRTIELYRATVFPYEWVIDKVLVDNINCVDSTIFIGNNQIKLITYETLDDKKYLNIYNLDMIKKVLNIENKIPFKTNVGRPAGSIIDINGKLIRPSQNCENKYGEGIIFNEVSLDKEGKYDEKFLSTYSLKNIELTNIDGADRLHTINRLNNIEVIDVLKEKIDLLRPYKMLKRQTRRKINIYLKN